MFFVFFLNTKTFSFFRFSGPKKQLQSVFSRKIKSTLQNTRSHYQRVALEQQSDLCCNRQHVTAIKQARRQGQRHNSLHCAGCVRRTNGFLQKTAYVIAIRGTVHRSTSDIPRSTEGCLKMLGSETVLMMTQESNLLRHRSKCLGPSGMHQSAEATKDSFHNSETLLLTSHLAEHAGRSITCQPLTVWRSRVTPAWLPSSLKVALGM